MNDHNAFSQSKSQTSLLTRVASTTDLLPHTQSLHSKFSLYNAGAGIAPAGQLPAIPSRPGSSRPRSRVELRPMSSRPMSSRPPQIQIELSSRPATRLEPSRSPSRSMSRQQSAGPRQVITLTPRQPMHSSVCSKIFTLKFMHMIIKSQVYLWLHCSIM